MYVWTQPPVRPLTPTHLHIYHKPRMWRVAYAPPDRAEDSPAQPREGPLRDLQQGCLLLLRSINQGVPAAEDGASSDASRSRTRFIAVAFSVNPTARGLPCAKKLCRDAMQHSIETHVDRVQPTLNHLRPLPCGYTELVSNGYELD